LDGLQQPGHRQQAGNPCPALRCRGSRNIHGSYVRRKRRHCRRFRHKAAFRVQGAQVQQHHHETWDLVAFAEVVLHNVVVEEAALHHVHKVGQSCPEAPCRRQKDAEKHQVTRTSVDRVAVAEKVDQEHDTGMFPLSAQVEALRVVQMEMGG